MKIEDATLELFSLAITASLEKRDSKLNFLNPARIKVEVLKRLFRLCNELHIVENNRYIEFENDLQEISKMINGWIKYLS
jgi:four helix bundle protein